MTSITNGGAYAKKHHELQDGEVSIRKKSFGHCRTHRQGWRDGQEERRVRIVGDKVCVTAMQDHSLMSSVEGPDHDDLE